MSTGTPGRGGAKGRTIKPTITDPQGARAKRGPGGVKGDMGVGAVEDVHQVIVEAQAHGTPQEHDLLKPVIDGVRKHFAAIGNACAVDEAAFLADAGYNSERGLKALAADNIDGYIADGQMRKRDPRYTDARVHKRASKAKTFQPKDFTFDREHGTCICPANQTLKLNSANAMIGGRKATVFKGTAATCERCPLRSQCLRKPDVTAVRPVAFFTGIAASQLPPPH